MATKVTSNVIADNAVTDAKLHSDFTATTQSASDNSTSVATTAYVTTAIANLSDSAPSTLNTLNELAAALNDDASFSTTVTNSIATKLPLAGGTLTGHLRGTTFGTNLTTTVGVGGTPADSNTAELGPGYLNLARDDTANAKQILFGKNGTVHSYLETTSTGLNIGGSLVGIGGTPSNAQLDIKASNSNKYIYADDGTNALLEVKATTSQLELSSQTTGYGAWEDMHIKSHNLLFYQSNSEKMRIDSAGKVGIGTTSPSRNLSVVSDSYYSLELQGSNAYNNLVDTGVVFSAKYNSGNAVTDIASIRGGRFSTSDGNYAGVLKFFTRPNGGSDTERMRISYDGNVGIGTTSPGAKLEVSGKDDYGAGDLIRLIFDNSPADTGITFADINSTIKSRITMDAANTADLRVSSASQMHFYTGTSNGTTDPGNLTIDSSGYVGIGADPAWLGLTGSGTSRVLHVGGTNAQLRLTNSIIHHDNAGLTKLTIRNNYGATSASATMELQAGSIYFCTGTSFTERLRINHLGRQAYSGSATANGHGNFVGEVGTGYKALAFERTVGGGEVGSIVSNTSSTTYNTSSDYRLKENIDYTWDATTRLKQLKPARFNWIVDDTNTLLEGFLAHEVSSIVPEAIYGEKDGMTDPILYEAGDEIPEGKSIGDVKTAPVPDYQAIDHSKLVPLLVKTIQELEERLTAGGL